MNFDKLSSYIINVLLKDSETEPSKCECCGDYYQVRYCVNCGHWHCSFCVNELHICRKCREYAITLFVHRYDIKNGFKNAMCIKCLMEHYGVNCLGDAYLYSELICNDYDS